MPAAANGTRRTSAGPPGTSARTRDAPAGTRETPAGTRDAPAGTRETPAGTRRTPAGTRRTATRARGLPVAAATLPVARIAVDMPLAHLDRPFDYQVPESLSAAAVPGCRVRVRFAGRLTSGFVLERVAASEHGGRLAFLERVVSPEPVLTAEIAGLARAVADRYAGTLADVMRIGIKSSHS
jgi:primosomal protein N' (replication factor Y)